jgi:hypothetical protein
LPQLGLAERIASFVPGAREVLSTESQRDRALTNFLNLTGIPSAIGYGTTVVTPKTIRGELYRRTKKQQATIQQLVEESGADTDWIRQQLRLGRTPAEIAEMLRYGYGQEAESERSTMRPESRNAYLRLIEGLNQ